MEQSSQDPPPLIPIRDQQPAEEDANSKPRKRQKKSHDAAVSPASSLPKHPVTALNEINSNLVYDFVESGPSYNRVYTASVTIDGQVYKAEDFTKKKAKAKVAEIILQCLHQLKDPSLKYPLQEQESSTCQGFSQAPITGANILLDPEVINQRVVDKFVKSQRDPVYNLNLLRPGLKFEFQVEGEAHARKFTANGKCLVIIFFLRETIYIFLSTVWIDDVNYQGIGSSKKKAKREAAYNALSKGLSLEFPPKVNVNSPDRDSSYATSEFGDYIAQYVILSDILLFIEY